MCQSQHKNSIYLEIPIWHCTKSKLSLTSRCRRTDQFVCIYTMFTKPIIWLCIGKLIPPNTSMIARFLPEMLGNRLLRLGIDYSSFPKAFMTKNIPKIDSLTETQEHWSLEFVVLPGRNFTFRFLVFITTIDVQSWFSQTVIVWEFFTIDANFPWAGVAFCSGLSWLRELAAFANVRSPLSSHCTSDYGRAARTSITGVTSR